MSTAPRVRRPRQATFGDVKVIYVEGAGAPWKVIDVDGRTVHASRRRSDAVAYATGKAAA